MEWLIGCGGFFKRFGPGAFEVNGVGQDQSRNLSEAAGGKDILDFVFGLLRDPAIDLVPRRFSAGDEVSLVDIGLIFALGSFEEGGKEGMTLLRPYRVGDVEFDAFLLAGLAKSSL